MRFLLVSAACLCGCSALEAKWTPNGKSAPFSARARERMGIDDSRWREQDPSSSGPSLLPDTAQGWALTAVALGALIYFWVTQQASGAPGSAAPQSGAGPLPWGRGTGGRGVSLGSSGAAGDVNRNTSAREAAREAFLRRHTNHAS